MWYKENMEMETIETDQFILRPYQKGDEASLRKHINNKNVAKDTVEIPHPYSAEDANEWIRNSLRLQKEESPEEVRFALVIDGEVVGGISLVNIEGHKAEIGYWLGEDYWGKGLMTEAVEAVTKYGFEVLKLKRIYAYTFPTNKGSQRVLEKAGYELEGRLRKYVEKDGELRDDLLYARIAD